MALVKYFSDNYMIPIQIELSTHQIGIIHPLTLQDVKPNIGLYNSGHKLAAHVNNVDWMLNLNPGWNLNPHSLPLPYIQSLLK